MTGDHDVEMMAGMLPPPEQVAVETVTDGSEVQEILNAGGVVVEARLPPVATAMVAPLEEARAVEAANVLVQRDFMLPGGGAVQVEAAYSVPVDVLPLDLVTQTASCRIQYTPAVADATPLETASFDWRRRVDDFGPQDRETFYCGDEGCVFEFCGLRLEPEPWPAEVLAVRGAVARAAGVPETALTACLVNRYPANAGFIPFHSDDVRDHDPKLVASLSVGGPRRFRLRAKTVAETPAPLVDDLVLDSGSLLVMSGPDAHALYEHELPLIDGDPPRISCTFRAIRPRPRPPSSSS